MALELAIGFPAFARRLLQAKANFFKQAIFGIQYCAMHEFLNPFNGHSHMTLTIDVCSPVVVLAIAPDLNVDFVHDIPPERPAEHFLRIQSREFTCLPAASCAQSR